MQMLNSIVGWQKNSIARWTHKNVFTAVIALPLPSRYWACYQNPIFLELLMFSKSVKNVTNSKYDRFHQVKQRSHSKIIEQCVSKLRKSNDGGGVDMDKTTMSNTEIFKVHPSKYKVPMWQDRDNINKERGFADWVVPTSNFGDCRPLKKHGFKSRILFIHGGAHQWYSPWFGRAKHRK